MLPSQRKVDVIAGETFDLAAAIYADHIVDVSKMVQRAGNVEDAQAALLQIDGSFIGSLGETFRTGSLLAGNAGISEVRSRRKRINAEVPSARSAALRPPPPPRERRGVMAARRAEVVEYSGRNLEYDYFKLQSFTIAHVEDKLTRDAVQAELAQVLSGELAWSEAQHRIRDLLEGLIDKQHISTVVQTNLQVSLGAAKYGEGLAAIDVLPYWEYVTAGDGRVRASHAALAGVIRRKDDPFWAKFYPPWDYNCRCSVLEHDDSSLEQEDKQDWLTRNPGPASAEPGAGWIGHTDRIDSILQQLAAQYELKPLQAGAYGFDELVPKASSKLQVPSANEVVDYEGRLRQIDLARVANPELAAATLAGPAEVWGYPGSALKYIETFATPQGLKTVVCEVLGDVQQVITVNGNGNEFRVGLLLYKKS